MQELVDKLSRSMLDSFISKKFLIELAVKHADISEDRGKELLTQFQNELNLISEIANYKN